MIKNQMLFPLAVDTATVKATTDILYTATDEEIGAYTIGFVPWEMVQESVIFKGMQVGTLAETGNLNFSYLVDDSFKPDRGVPFCYSYAASPTSASLNAYNGGSGYIDLPWGTASTAGLIHAYNTDSIVQSSPASIQETTGIFARFVMFCVLLPEGSEGGASPGSGLNGWVQSLVDKTTTIDPLTLEFSVTSGTYSSYMPTPVTFTQDDLTDAVNGVMVKQNGTTTYAGIVYNIYVHCIISNAYLDQISATTLKNGIVQLDRLRYSGLGGVDTPLFAYVANSSTKSGVFTANAIDSISIDYPSGTVYYIQQSTTSYEYFKISGTNANNLLSGGFTVTDLKILRSIARPIYKISGAFYVAEFTDDYEITGELIPYAQARDWQKNINPDENTFDPADIPEPTPGDDSADSGGDNILPYDFVNTPLSAANNFTTLYALTTDQVSKFGAIMWASLSDDNFWHAVGVTFTNDFSINPADMMRYFVFLRYYPFDLSGVSSSYSYGIYIGRSTYPIQFPTGTAYPRRVLRNLYQIDGGEVIVSLPSPYDSDDFYTMDPCTQVQAHIPYCGRVQLPASEVYGKKLKLQYVVDLQTGAIQAIISVVSDSQYIIATLAGTCGASVQITANNNIEFLTRIATVATGGISEAGTMATQGAKIAGEEGAAAGAVLGALTGTVSALAGLPPVTVHSQGNTTGFANYGGDKQAYITVVTVKRSIPQSFAKSCGYVSNKQAKIGDLKGYTEMINPDLTGIAAHEDELAEIYRLLTTGFYA